MTGLWAALADLVLPSSCAGCAGTKENLLFEVCPRCREAVEALRPHAATPTPAPAGLPPVFALGEYGGELRDLILEYKDRGRHRLAEPLGALLARVVPHRGPVLLLYVPDTARAARDRYGDHMKRLATAAAARLPEAMVLNTLWARPKPDSAALDTAQRAQAARDAFALRRAHQARRAAAGRAVVLLDDIVTTGATLAAAAELLAEGGVEVASCAVLAATRRRVPA